MIQLLPLTDIATVAVEALLDRAFGRDRHTRTAYAIRGSAAPVAALSFAAIRDGTLVGTVQCWPVALATIAGEMPLVMVGPVAVEPTHQQGGIGRLLMARALDAAASEGLDGALMLIGDPDYYGRFFGFDAARTAAWDAPGPVERHRLLARGSAVPDTAGLLGPRATVAPILPRQGAVSPKVTEGADTQRA